MNGLTWLMDSWMSFFTCLIGDLTPDISRILNESLSPFTLIVLTLLDALFQFKP